MKFLISILFIVIVFSIKAQIIVPIASQWSYSYTLSDNDALTFFEPSFNVDSWQKGNSPFWYGDGSDGTNVAEMLSTTSTLFLRTQFLADTSKTYSKLTVKANYDDGFVLWINGEKALSINAPDVVKKNSMASSSHESGSFETFTVDLTNIALLNGINHVAVLVLNQSILSSDIHFNAELSVEIMKPKAKKVTVNFSSGFYDAPFDVEIVGEQAGDTILYTLNGSDPSDSVNVVVGYAPLTVNINPSSSAHRDNTPSVILRASKYSKNFNPSIPITKTYIFLQKVKSQTYPGGNWPIGSVNRQEIDYAMDADIVNDPRYADSVSLALLDIPTVSLVTSVENLFNKQTGIYVNAKQHGQAWERPVSMEIIYPDGQEGIQIDAGLRIRGGSSRNFDNPKHAFRLFFRSEYGESKLRYPLFGDEGADEFDKIDFRTSQNYSWSFTNGDVSSFNTMNREVFSRDLQGKMGQPYTRSRYYHLYLNGVYWGLYQSQERAEARYAETYFGGDSEEYDVVKVNHEGRVIEATDGTMDLWEDVWDLTQEGYTNNQNYFKLIGCNEEGKIDTTKQKLLSPENLIDYVLIIFYTGNFDVPTNTWTFNKGTNNFFAIQNRERKRDGFKFFMHDAEHSLLAVPITKGVGVTENRVNIGFLTNEYQMLVTEFRYFQPQWLQHKLMENQEFKQLFVDRVFKWFFKEKLLTPDSCSTLFLKRAKEIETAIIAESARWGDAKMSVPRNKIDDWIPAVNMVVNDFMSVRTNIVLDQLKEVGWYTEFSAPAFYVGLNQIEGYTYELTGTVNFSIVNPDQTGTIYYTTDGSDPRIIGGAVSSVAKAFTKSESLNITSSTAINARIKHGEVWSALNTLTFLGADNTDNIVITEIHYNPFDTETIKGKELEFIELKNIGSKPVSLSGTHIFGGINYSFPEGTIIYPGQFMVLASNYRDFEENYGMVASGDFSGHLSNSGDVFTLGRNAFDMSFTALYTDKEPWPVVADGEGYSLVSSAKNPSSNPQESSYWKASFNVGGSPFADDVYFANSIKQFAESKSTLTVFPNPVSEQLFIRFQTPDNIPVSTRLFDINGRQVAQFKTLMPQNGMYRQSINIGALNLQSGIYVLQVNQIFKRIIVE